MSEENLAISVIVLTYNRPDALGLVLLALDNQDVDGFEVIIADDGSSSETKDAIDLLKSKVNYNIRHVWQNDDGFRISMIRNKCVALAKGDYLVFLDGDSVPQTTFIKRHRRLAKESYFVAGNRALLSSDLTNEVLADNLPVYQWSLWVWFRFFCQRKINRIMPLLFLGEGFWRYLFKTRWRGAKTCNVGMWKKDFLAVNGFDESYYGWGYEDSDLIVRLIHYGVLRKEGRFALPILHLYHSVSSRDRKGINYKKLEETIKSSRFKAEIGVAQYI